MVSQVEKINFEALGFFPAKVSEEKIEIVAGEEQIVFDPGIERFEEVEIEDYEGDHAQKIKKATKDNVWFDDFKVVRFAKRAIRDPFLLGIKDGKYYFICFWNTDIWA